MLERSPGFNVEREKSSVSPEERKRRKAEGIRKAGETRKANKLQKTMAPGIEVVVNEELARQDRETRAKEIMSMVAPGLAKALEEPGRDIDEDALRRLEKISQKVRMEGASGSLQKKGGEWKAEVKKVGVQEYKNELARLQKTADLEIRDTLKQEPPGAGKTDATEKESSTFEKRLDFVHKPRRLSLVEKVKKYFNKK